MVRGGDVSVRDIDRFCTGNGMTITDPDMNSADSAHIYQPNEENADFRERLMELLREKSFRSGETITLASGKESNYYFNTKPTMLDPEGAGLIAELMLDALEEVDAEFIGGLEMGAVPLASAIAPASFFRDRALRAFIVRKEPKGHGTASQIEGLIQGENFDGRKVIVVEDVTTTGGSAIKAAEIIREVGGDVVQVITIVDRQEGASAIFKENGLPFMALFGASEFLAADEEDAQSVS